MLYNLIFILLNFFSKYFMSIMDVPSDFNLRFNNKIKHIITLL